MSSKSRDRAVARGLFGCAVLILIASFTTAALIILSARERIHRPPAPATCPP